MSKNADRKFFGIRQKLIVVIVAFTLIVVAIITSITLDVYTKYAKEVTQTAFSDQTQQMNNIIDSFVSSITKQIAALSVNPSIKAYMSGVKNDLEGFRTINSATNAINSYQYDSPYVNVYLYNIKQNMLLSTDKQSNLTDYSDTDIKNQQWYTDVMSSKTDLKVITNFKAYNSDTTSTFSVALKLVGSPIKEINGIIVFSLSEDFVKSLIKDTSFVNDKYVDLVIANGENSILYLSNKEPDFDVEEMLRQGIFSKSTNKEYTICENVSDYTGWSIYAICKNDKLYEQLNNTTMMIAAVTTIGILILVAIIIYICNKFINPIVKLSKLMKQSEKYRYTLRAEIKNNDETTELSRCFNAMLDSVVENQILRKDAEIYALQQQINPHFLYNTLGAIKTLTKLERDSDAMLVVDSLSNMFRYSVNLGKNKYVSLEKELNHVKNYLNIMRIRFDNSFKSEINVDENCYKYLVPCFILQPLVENSLTHGIDQMLSSGIITISVSELENTLAIEISDNGKGIEESELATLMDSIEKQQPADDTTANYGFALANVHNRIKLVNESLEGLKITSSKNQGFTVRINLPKITKPHSNLT